MLPAAVPAAVTTHSATLRALDTTALVDGEHARSRSVIEQFPSATAVYEGPDHVVVAASEVYRRIVGGRDLIGLPFREALPELHEQGFTALLDRAFATGEPVTGKGVEAAWDDDGDGEVEPHFVDFTYQPVTDPGGRVWGIVVHLSDVTAREQAESALGRSEAQFRAVFEHAAVGIAIGGIDRAPIAINPALSRMLRYSVDELRASGFDAITHPEDRDRTRALYRDLLTGDADAYRTDTRYIRKGGGLVWADLTVSLVRGSDGAPLYTIGMVLDTTERKRVEALLQEQAVELEQQVEEGQALNEELRTATDEARAAQGRVSFLARASELLASSLDYELTLRRVAELSIERLADWCVVEIHNPDGTRRSRTVTHRDPSKVVWADEIERRYPADPDAETGAPAVARTGRSEMYAHVTDELLAGAAQDEEHLRILREVGFTAVIIVPIAVRGHTLGTLSLVSAESAWRYTEDDLALAEDLGRRAGTAIENAQLLQDAERAAGRARRLQAFAAALNVAADMSAVAEVCVRYGMDAMGADAGSLAVLVEDGSAFEILHSRGYARDVATRWGRFPAERGKPLSDAVLDGVPRIFGSAAEIEAEYPEVVSDFVQTDMAAFVGIPVVAGGRPLGALSFSFAAEQHFDEGERTFLLTLGEQAAQALERARLLEAEQRLRQRAEILADAGAKLSESLDLDSTLDALARLVVPRVADWCFVELLAEDGRILPAAIHHSDPAQVARARAALERYPIDPDAPYGTAEVLRTGVATLAPEIPPGAFEAVARDEEHLALLNGMEFRSHISLPLQVRGRTFGVLSLVTAESERRYGPEDLAFGEDLARRVAVAVDNAQLYRAERQTREAAEAANRAKSEFLSIMSHELRTPLNAVGGYAELIEMGVHGPVTDAQREALVRIQRSQRHLLGLINEVLNYARVDAGQVAYTLEDVAVADAVAASEALVAPQIRGRELAYEFAGCDPALTAYADADKLQQILLNLLGNAIKFSRPAARITVACAADEHAVYIRVEDTGIGIPADRLENIFEHFVQVDAKLTRNEGGVGLGLAISRDLARAMGGDLTVVSEEGEGSTFTLRLPRRP